MLWLKSVANKTWFCVILVCFVGLVKRHEFGKPGDLCGNYANNSPLPRAWNRIASDSIRRFRIRSDANASVWDRMCVRRLIGESIDASMRAIFSKSVLFFFQSFCLDGCWQSYWPLVNEACYVCRMCAQFEQFGFLPKRPNILIFKRVLMLNCVFIAACQMARKSDAVRYAHGDWAIDDLFVLLMKRTTCGFPAKWLQCGGMNDWDLSRAFKSYLIECFK